MRIQEKRGDYMREEDRRREKKEGKHEYRREEES